MTTPTPAAPPPAPEDGPILGWPAEAGDGMVSPDEPAPGSSVEGAGHTTTDAGGRSGAAPKREVAPGDPPLSAARLGADRAPAEDEAVERIPGDPTVSGARVGARPRSPDDAIPQAPGDPTVGGARVGGGHKSPDAAIPQPPGDPTVRGARFGVSTDEADKPAEGPRAQGDLPTGGTRIQFNLTARPAGATGTSGLEGLFDFPPISRGSGPRPPAPEPEDESPAPPEVQPLKVVEQWAELAPDQRKSPAGAPRELYRERVVIRVDFRYQRFEELRVHEGWFRCPIRPDLEAVKARWPAFVAGGMPLGNGAVARLIEARYADASILAEQARLLVRLGLALRPAQLAQLLDKVALAVVPVVQAQRDRLKKAKRSVDSRPANLMVQQGQKQRAGSVCAITDNEDLVLVFKPDADGPADPGLALCEGAASGGAVAEGWLRDHLGWTRRGTLKSLRRRLALALPTHPQEAAAGLHLAFGLAKAWTPDPDLAALGAAAASLQAWLQARRAEFQQPEDAFGRAVAFGVDAWTALQPLGPDGRILPDPKMGGTGLEPKPAWRILDEEQLETALLWVGLSLGCQRLGLRPWRYFAELLEATARGPLDRPGDWTPAAWARRSGPR